MSSGQNPDDLLKRAYSLSTVSETRDLYRDWAETYDQTMMDGLGYLTPAKTSALLAAHLENKTACVLDVGCGTGLAGEHLGKLGYTRIDGLDFSPEMIGVASQRLWVGKPVYSKFHEADLNQILDIADNMYDALICTGTFTHAHVSAECLAELFRILKPGGLFACTIHMDVWAELNFDAKVEELEARGVISALSKDAGTYFETDEQPVGWFILWEKTV